MMLDLCKRGERKNILIIDNFQRVYENRLGHKIIRFSLCIRKIDGEKFLNNLF